MTAAIQMRIDGIKGWALPLRPEVLAGLNEFERGHIFSVLRLDPGQEACVEEAIALVLRGEYGRAK